MSKEIKATPTSRFTSELTEIIVQDTPNVRIVFEGLQVDNNAELSKNIKGSLIIKKRSKPTVDFDDETKFTRRNISAYDCVEITFDTEQTFNLARGLYNYFRYFSGKQTNPFDDIKYVRVDDENERVIRLLSSRTELLSFLEGIDTDNLNLALNITNLTKIKKDIEDNIENDDEAYWQSFFYQHSWALSQLFHSPLMIYAGARYVGGKALSNKGGKITDFLYQNKISQNVSILEIKTPCSSLFTSRSYREDVPEMSKELVGGINQVLLQKQTLMNEYATIRSNSLDDGLPDFYALNPQCILLIGNLSKLGLNEKKCFEIFRNDLKTVAVITFDELLQKIDNIIQLLS